jgi:hypothetical protein
MKIKHIILMMITGMIFISISLLLYIYIIINTPSLWGVRAPLIYLGLCGVGAGTGVMIFSLGSVTGIIQTKNRIKKEIGRHKVLKILKK